MKLTSRNEIAMAIPGVAGRVAVIALSVIGLVIAVYLLWTSVAQAGQPIGCGEGSGCAEVLNSKWSQLFGIPVSALAALTYLGLICGMLFLPIANPIHRGKVWLLIMTIAILLLFSAAWFIGLQVFYLKAICPWCMTEHALGTLIALLILGFHVASFNRANVSAKRPVMAGITFPFCIALLLFGQMAIGQWLTDFQAPKANRLDRDDSASDTGAGPQRSITMLDGRIELRPADRPMIGSADAEHVIVLLLDYCCPHCRTTHGYLMEAMRQFPDQFAIVLCPMPLNSDCNPYWETTEPRFAESCDLARLALAVWKLEPSKFPQFDQWLFEPSRPRLYADALDEASDLVDSKALGEILKTESWLNEMIKENARFYVSSGAERIPVLLAPGFSTVVGRPGSQEELNEILQQDLGLNSSHRSPD